MAKKKIIKTDGLGPQEIKKIRAAVRQVWHRSHARKLCVERSIGADGFHRCENPKCKKKVPKVHIDHIENVGDVDHGFIKRMFVPSNRLRALCKKCHDAKTKEERKRAKEALKGFY